MDYEKELKNDYIFNKDDISSIIDETLFRYDLTNCFMKFMKLYFDSTIFNVKSIENIVNPFENNETKNILDICGINSENCLGIFIKVSLELKGKEINFVIHMAEIEFMDYYYKLDPNFVFHMAKIEFMDYYHKLDPYLKINYIEKIKESFHMNIISSINLVLFPLDQQTISKLSNSGMTYKECVYSYKFEKLKDIFVYAADEIYYSE